MVEVDPELPLPADQGDVLAVDDNYMVATVVERMVDGLERERKFKCDVCCKRGGVQTLEIVSDSQCENASENQLHSRI